MSDSGTVCRWPGCRELESHRIHHGVREEFGGHTFVAEPAPAEQPQGEQHFAKIHMREQEETESLRPPVAASPAEGPRQEIAWPITGWCMFGDGHKDCPGKGPSSDDPRKILACKCRCHSAAAQLSPDAAKVKEIAREILAICPVLNGKIRPEFEEIAAILRLYFPADATAEVRELRARLADVHRPNHGPCCTCQICGKNYDDCRCDLDEVAEKLIAAEAQLKTAQEALRWLPIESAPKDGTHIRAADFSGNGVGFGGNPPQSYQCVVHWWQWSDGTHQEEWGWYPSTGAGENPALTNLTHWKPLEELTALSVTAQSSSVAATAAGEEPPAK